MNPSRERPTEPVAIWQDDWTARWMVPVATDEDPTDENPWRGWFDIDANARTGLIDVAGVDFTPDEARKLAHCLHSAADHIVMYAQRRIDALRNLTYVGQWPELDGQPHEIQRIARDAVGAAADRIRRQASDPSSVVKQQAQADLPAELRRIAAEPRLCNPKYLYHRAREIETKGGES